MPAETPSQLATRYLLKIYAERHHGSIPPVDLTSAVIQAVIALGYTRALVEKLLTQWDKAND